MACSRSFLGICLDDTILFMEVISLFNYVPYFVQDNLCSKYSLRLSFFFGGGKRNSE